MIHKILQKTETPEKIPARRHPPAHIRTPSAPRRAGKRTARDNTSATILLDSALKPCYHRHGKALPEAAPPVQLVRKTLRNRHLAEWRFLLFTVTVIVKNKT